jgi:hypothetical protein
MNPSERGGRLPVGPASTRMRRAEPMSSGARVHYTLASLFVGMKPGDMPKALGWDDAQPLGKEVW